MLRSATKGKVGSTDGSCLEANAPNLQQRNQAVHAPTPTACGPGSSDSALRAELAGPVEATGVLKQGFMHTSHAVLLNTYYLHGGEAHGK